jgi:hypothetical protein
MDKEIFTYIKSTTPSLNIITRNHIELPLISNYSFKKQKSSFHENLSYDN